MDTTSGYYLGGAMDFLFSPTLEKQVSRDLLENERFQLFVDQGYALTTAATPWDYRAIITGKAFREIRSLEEANHVMEKFGYLQWFQALPFPEAPEDLTHILFEAVESINRINRI